MFKTYSIKLNKIKMRMNIKKEEEEKEEEMWRDATKSK
jgi:hypothetical protein